MGRQKNRKVKAVIEHTSLEQEKQVVFIITQEEDILG